MLSKLKLAKAAIAIAVSGVVLSAYADVLTQSKIDWNPGLTSEIGGTATVHYKGDGDGGLDSVFQINVAPFKLSMEISNYATYNWLTPVVGSDVTFNPVTLHLVDGANKDVFVTSMGLGFRNPTSEVWDGGNLLFPDYFQWWNIEISRPSDAGIDLISYPEGPHTLPVSNVPEPKISLLLMTGLLMVRIFAQKTRQKNLSPTLGAERSVSLSII